MRYLFWLLRAALFLVLLGFAVKNDQAVTLKFFAGAQWDTSLVVVLLCFISLGAMLGIFAMLEVLLRQRRELANAQRELYLLRKLDEAQAANPPSP